MDDGCAVSGNGRRDRFGKIEGALAVEMEAAALYAFAASANVQVLCLAHVTNTMGQAGDDFEKGEADGTRDALAVLLHLVNAFRAEDASKERHHP